MYIVTYMCMQQMLPWLCVCLISGATKSRCVSSLHPLHALRVHLQLQVSSWEPQVMGMVMCVPVHILSPFYSTCTCTCTWTTAPWGAKSHISHRPRCESHPVRRMCFCQCQASSAALGWPGVHTCTCTCTCTVTFYQQGTSQCGKKNISSAGVWAQLWLPHSTYISLV